MELVVFASSLRLLSTRLKASYFGQHQNCLVGRVAANFVFLKGNVYAKMYKTYKEHDTIWRMVYLETLKLSYTNTREDIHLLRVALCLTDSVGFLQSGLGRNTSGLSSSYGGRTYLLLLNKSSSTGSPKSKSIRFAPPLFLITLISSAMSLAVVC